MSTLLAILDSIWVWAPWNLFLAAVPWVISSVLVRLPQLAWPLVVLLLAVTVVFLPNAPYLLTDFIHLFQLKQRQPDLVVPAVPIYLATAFFGMLAYSGTLVNLQRIALLMRSAWPWPPMLIGLHLLSAWGVWVGRSLRFNSWDLLDHPLRVASQCLELLANPESWQELLSLGLLLALSHLLIRSIFWPSVAARGWPRF
jgi:uncharacterized membrane protein